MLGASLSDVKRPLPLVFGCSGPTLTAAERAFFKQYTPFGVIVFKRNCADPGQLSWLVKELRLTTGYSDLQILIDQEGGRVERLQPPHWGHFPPARVWGEMYEKDPEWGTEAAQCYARLTAHDLRKVGVTINCAPVVDLLVDGASPAIGDRALSRKPAVIAAVARAMAEAYLSHGIVPVVKHFPGHGRLPSDPHHELPTITTSRAELESDDFVAFGLLKDLPMGMNSHAIFKDIDPLLPASLSSVMHQEIIRGLLGFDGVVLSDDITMKALQGTAALRAERALDAGADIVLHCSGDLDEMTMIAQHMAPMGEESWQRWVHAKTMLGEPSPFYNREADLSRLDTLLGGLAYQGKV